MEVTLSRQYRVAITLNRGDFERLADLLTQVGVVRSYEAYTGKYLAMATDDFDEFLTYLSGHANGTTEVRLTSSSFDGRTVTVFVRQRKTTPIEAIIEGPANEVTYIDNRLSEWVNQVKQSYSWIACLELNVPWYYLAFILGVFPVTLWLYPTVESIPLTAHFWLVVLIILLLCGLAWRPRLCPPCLFVLGEGIERHNLLAFLRFIYVVFAVFSVSAAIWTYGLFLNLK